MLLLDLMLKSSILFISLNRNNDYKCWKSFKTCFWFQSPLMWLIIFCEYFHLRLFHNCLSQNLEHIYMFQHNLYIGDVKVSPGGRCLELLQQTNRAEKLAIGQFLQESLPWLTNDRDTKHENMTSVCFSLLWSENCKQNHACFWTESGYKLKTEKCKPFRGRKIWNSEQR